MRVCDLLNTLVVMGKIKSPDNINKVKHKESVESIELSEDTVRFIKEILRKYELDDYNMVDLIYAMTDSEYVNFLSIMYKNDYERSFEKAIKRFTGQRFKLTIYKGFDFNFGDVKVKKLGTYLLGVVDKKGNVICKGNVFIITKDMIYRQFSDKYMLCIDKNGEMSKIKKKKASNIKGVQLCC